MQYYISQIVQALKYLQEHNIMHRDLKLPNLMLGYNLHIKIVDFGLAAKLEFNGERHTDCCGTANYMAPEQMHPLKGHTLDCDIFSLGIIMFNLITGQSPTETSDLESLKTLYASDQFKPKFTSEMKVSLEAQDLIT